MYCSTKNESSTHPPTHPPTHFPLIKQPAALSGLELGRFTIGKQPPVIRSAQLLLKDNHNNFISEDRIVLNLGLAFHAPDLEVVVRPSHPPTHVNPPLHSFIYSPTHPPTQVAAKTVGATIPLAVKDVWFDGKLRIEIDLVRELSSPPPLFFFLLKVRGLSLTLLNPPTHPPTYLSQVPEFPHAKTVIVTFLEKPIVDFSVVPLKSVNIFDVPGLSQFISNLILSGINDNLGKLFHPPCTSSSIDSKPNPQQLIPTASFSSTQPTHPPTHPPTYPLQSILRSW